jgi:hypothetical protein
MESHENQGGEGYPPDQLENRATKIAGWFEYLDGLYSRVHGRSEGSAEGEGFDPAPAHRPCEHRRQWRQGDLCLACDNTGWRRCAAGEEGIDPYTFDIRGSVTREVPGTLEGARLDAEIARLEQLASVRAGTDLAEDPQTRQFRLVSNRHRTLGKILFTLQRIRLSLPDFRARSPEGLRLLALIVPGSIARVPE